MDRFRVYLQRIDSWPTMWVEVEDECIIEAIDQVKRLYGAYFKIIHIGEIKEDPRND